MTKKVKIEVKRYMELLEAEAILDALNSGGVDSWDWHSASLDDHYVEPALDQEVIED